MDLRVNETRTLGEQTVEMGERLRQASLLPESQRARMKLVRIGMCHESVSASQ